MDLAVILTIGLLVLVLMLASGLVFVAWAMLGLIRANAATSDNRLKQWEDFSQNWSEDHREHRIAMLSIDRTPPEPTRPADSRPASTTFESGFKPPTFDDPTNPG